MSKKLGLFSAVFVAFLTAKSAFATGPVPSVEEVPTSGDPACSAVLQADICNSVLVTDPANVDEGTFKSFVRGIKGQNPSAAKAMTAIAQNILSLRPDLANAVGDDALGVSSKYPQSDFGPQLADTVLDMNPGSISEGGFMEFVRSIPKQSPENARKSVAMASKIMEQNPNYGLTVGHDTLLIGAKFAGTDFGNTLFKQLLASNPKAFSETSVQQVAKGMMKQTDNEANATAAMMITLFNVRPDLRIVATNYVKSLMKTPKGELPQVKQMCETVLKATSQVSRALNRGLTPS